MQKACYRAAGGAHVSTFQAKIDALHVLPGRPKRPPRLRFVVSSSRYHAFPKMQSYKMNQCIYIVLHFAFKKRVLFEKRKGQNNSIVFAVQEKMT